MAKKTGFNPFIILSTMPTPEPTTVIGGGTGQSTTDPYACDYNDWMNLFATDYNNNGFDEDDYHHWFVLNFYDGDWDELQDLWELCGNDGNVYPDPLG